MVVVNVSPDFSLKPEWLVGEIDFDYEMSKQAAEESHGKGVRTGASRDFEAEMKWAVDTFIDHMEKKGHYYLPDMGAPVIKGPFLPRNYGDDWPKHPESGEELPRKQERSIEDTGGRVCYRIAAPFLVREHIHRTIVERDAVSEAEWKAIKNPRKENGLWIPQKQAPPLHL